jgi:hypothetical protein
MRIGGSRGSGVRGISWGSTHIRFWLSWNSALGRKRIAIQTHDLTRKWNGRRKVGPFSAERGLEVGSIEYELY